MTLVTILSNGYLGRYLADFENVNSLRIFTPPFDFVVPNRRQIPLLFVIPLGVPTKNRVLSDSMVFSLSILRGTLPYLFLPAFVGIAK